MLCRLFWNLLRVSGGRRGERDGHAPDLHAARGHVELFCEGLALLGGGEGGALVCGVEHTELVGVCAFALLLDEGFVGSSVAGGGRELRGPRIAVVRVGERVRGLWVRGVVVVAGVVVAGMLRGGRPVGGGKQGRERRGVRPRGRGGIVVAGAGVERVRVRRCARGRRRCGEKLMLVAGVGNPGLLGKTAWGRVSGEHWGGGGCTYGGRGGLGRAWKGEGVGGSTREQGLI